jgi:hypothetical protein
MISNISPPKKLLPEACNEKKTASELVSWKKCPPYDDTHAHNHQG